MKTSSKALSALLVVGIIIVLNYIVGGLGLLNSRLDFTEDKLYTLSDGTKNIIGRLNSDKPVTIRFYASSEDRVMPPMLQNYARTVTDLLLEFEKESDGKIVIERLAPNPSTEEEDKAREDEVRGMQVNTEGDQLYLGMAVQCLAQKEVLPFLNPQEETALEYQIARAINKVSKSGKSVVGIMSGMKIMGDSDPMAQFRGQQGPPAWFFVQQLKMDYDVREVAVTADKIDDDINVLIALHPAGIDDIGQYAMDQFVMRGGQLIAFVDPKSLLAEAMGQQQQQNPMMRNAAPAINTQSNLKKLFDSWGVSFDPDRIVADVAARTQMQNRQNPTAITLSNDSFNKASRLTKDLTSIFTMTCGTFTLSNKEGINATTLVESTQSAATISVADADALRSQGLKAGFSPLGTALPIVVQLDGKFKTAFPEGKPAATEKPKLPGETGGAQADPAAPAAAAAPAEAAPAAPAAPAPAAPAAPISVLNQATTPAAPAAPAVPNLTANTAPANVNDGTLKESKGNPSVLLFADSDLMYDEFYLARDQMIGAMIERSSNLSLLLGAVEAYSGGGDLISVRNRASTTRPFTTRDKKQSEVEAAFRPQMSALESELQEAQGKLSSLRGTVDKATGRVIPTAQAQADIDNWAKKQTEIQRKIRDIKKAQRKELDKLDTRMTLLNFLLVPLLVIALGLFIAMRRNAATAAK
jgi:ABC-type uncharacterized transport system involved in gliding motility auxiliary subunit